MSRTMLYLLVLLGVVAAQARAEPLPAYTVREVVIQSSDVVLASHVEMSDPAQMPGKFRIGKVLKGSSVKPGDEIEIVGADIYSVGEFDFGQNSVPPKIATWLLFLAPDDSSRHAKKWQVVTSGVRCETAEGQVLVPMQANNPGPYYLAEPREESLRTNWETLLSEVRSDILAVQQVQRLRDIADPAARNRAIFAWIDEHRSEFRGNRFFGKSPGWGSLEEDTFRWIEESGDPQAAWSALVLNRAIREGDLKQTHFSGYSESGDTSLSFASKAGRSLLVGKIKAAETNDDERRLALNLLHSSMWVKTDRGNPRGASILSSQEQRLIILTVLPLLKDNNDKIRAEAVEVLHEASQRPEAGDRRRSELAVDALGEAYQHEAPGYIRFKLADALFHLAPPLYSKLTNNPPGFLIEINAQRITDSFGKDMISLHIVPHATRHDITKHPTLLMERLNDEGAVVEKKTMPLPITYPEDLWTAPGKVWASSSGMIEANLPTDELAEGTWRFVMQGVVEDGADDPPQTWRSEPAVLRLRRK